MTKYDIMDANPTMSKHTIERILSKLQSENITKRVEATRGAAYRREVLNPSSFISSNDEIKEEQGASINRLH